MSDTTVTTQAPPQVPMPNDSAARSPTGEILEPAQIAAQAKPTTPAANPDGTTPAPDATSTPKPDAKPAAPDAYTFAAPEGYTLDTKLVEDITPVFKELGLTQDAAQKLVDFHSKAIIEAAKAPQSTYETMRTEWVAAAKADPDMAKATNGDKTGLDAVKLDMGRALAALGDVALAADFRKAMDLTGVGDNPAFIKTFWKLSQFITEGKHVAGGGPSVHGQSPTGQGGRPSPAASLYPNLPN